ncbi:MAG: hypothetical protein LBG92_10330 [Prevotellaceae bacterium]|jgi:phosphoserine phosphatase|nr:hypothetical protein [Prevotellaceae bacterium]
MQIHGVSRSGKNYLIEHLVETMNAKCPKTLLFVNGSGTLKELSQKHFGIPLSESNEEQKNQLRLAFCPYLKEMQKSTDFKHIIVDGHYCFHIDNKFVTSFTDEERDIFDVFFYLNTPAEKIIENALNGDHNNNIAQMSIEKINQWKEIEIQGLKKSCKEIGKELIVLDRNFDDVVSFFENLLLPKNNLILDAKTIAEKMISENQTLINKYYKIILLDCDKTVSNNDTTYDFCKIMGIEKLALKEIFAGERYSLYQFFRTAKLYSTKLLSLYEEAAQYATNQAVINEKLLADIQINGNAFLTVGITSGIYLTWKNIQAKYHFPQIVVGGSNIRTDNKLVSSAVKFYFTRLLREMGKYVIAVGDSIIDVEMLEEADKSFIVAHEKLNSGMTDYFKKKQSKIQQLAYSNFQYDNVKTQKSLFL